jgi:hypothetical protein
MGLKGTSGPSENEFEDLTEAFVSTVSPVKVAVTSATLGRGCVHALSTPTVGAGVVNLPFPLELHFPSCEGSTLDLGSSLMIS